MRVQPQISQYYTTRYLMCTKETGQFKKCLLLGWSGSNIKGSVLLRLEEVIGKKGNRLITVLMREGFHFMFPIPANPIDSRENSLAVHKVSSGTGGIILFTADL